MDSPHPIRELIRTRTLEFVREPEAIFWVFIFPLFLAIGLGIAFRNQPQKVIQVGIADGAGAEGIEEALKRDSRFKVRRLELEAGRVDLARGRIDLLVAADGPMRRYIFDPTLPDGERARDRVDDALQRQAGRTDPLAVEDVAFEEPGSRYIDFLIPGLMGLNIMGGGLYGMGFVIVEMRVRKLLKRFLATPMRRSDFFLAMIASRILFLVPEILFLLLIGAVGFGVPMRGSVAALGTIALIGGLSFSGLGLLIGSRARKIESISGLINLVMLPMWIFCGVFFSTERFPEAMQPFIQALPLTAANNALRAVLLDGAALWTQWAEMLNLVVWGAVSFFISLRIFRWL